jgi:hypothetical protein
MPGLVPGIHDLRPSSNKDVDGRDEPGHDGGCSPRGLPLVSGPTTEWISGISNQSAAWAHIALKRPISLGGTPAAEP